MDLCPVKQDYSQPFEIPDEFKTITDWAKKGDEEKVEEFLKNGSDPNTFHREGWSILQSACMHESEEMIKSILKYKGNINITDRSGNTPLHYAVCFNSIDIVDLLVSSGAYIEAKNHDSVCRVGPVSVYAGGGRTPLMQAVVNNRKESVQYLLSKGADAFNVRDYDGRNAYELSLRRSKLPLCHILAPHIKEHVYVKEPIDIPKKVCRTHTHYDTDQ
eukprot:TRINITY_DN4744_c0_g1_i1.p1 TRINITY_DN4744_c0_g1~~TRINITY_DN4744_c0_g1_i1.p1  ORF type:complete len:217 (+),score=22.93 TRINITY_DN4744_c0_g1_i1:63-713(+)